MKLIFHVGLNKAGSTYIQDLLANNYDRLLVRGVFYPHPRLSKGIGGAQSGNAGELALLLDSSETKKVSEFISNIKSEAENHSANSILLSTEFMYHRLIKPDLSEVFKKACFENGIHDIELIVIFRSPVTHAISAYTHRAGNHELPVFEEWLNTITNNNSPNKYEFWNELDLFLKNLLHDPDYKLSIFPYSNNLDSVIKQVTGLNNLKELDRQSSNVSLTCVEAELVRYVAIKDRQCALQLRRMLKEVEKSKKADDSYLRIIMEEAVVKYSVNFQDNLDKLEKTLGQADLFSRVTVPKVQPALFDNQGRPNLLLSIEQIGTIIQAIEINQLNNFSLSQYLRYLIKRVLKKFKSLVQAKF